MKIKAGESRTPAILSCSTGDDGDESEEVMKEESRLFLRRAMISWTSHKQQCWTSVHSGPGCILLLLTSC